MNGELHACRMRSAGWDGAGDATCRMHSTAYRGGMKALGAILFLFTAATHAEIHPHTASPSGSYKLASEEVIQKNPDGTRSPLGAMVSLIDRDGATLSSCFHNAAAYQEIDFRDDWKTTAAWNKDETKVAVSSGGRTWSRVDFFAVNRKQVLPLPHPDWGGLLKGISGFQKTTRLYEMFSHWTPNGECVIRVSGTAFVGEKASEPYPQFSFTVTLRHGEGGIEVVEVREEME